MGSCTVVISSRLGNDPDFHYSEKGTAIARLSLPVDIGWGENKETEWVKVTVFGAKAEVCHKYLRKGSLVSVTGKLEKTWVSDKGQATIQMTANDVDFLSDFGEQKPDLDDGDFDDLPF